MLTDNPDDPRIKRGPADTSPVPQHEVYLVLSEAERAKGFVRPYRDSYRHVGYAPEHPLRDLTGDEVALYGKFGYIKYEQYPAGGTASGRYWTQDELDRQHGCGYVTTMARALSETYARDPGFYGATYCAHCGMHRPVREFRWVADDQVVGS